MFHVPPVCGSIIPLASVSPLSSALLLSEEEHQGTHVGRAGCGEWVWRCLLLCRGQSPVPFSLKGGQELGWSCASWKERQVMGEPYSRGPGRR